MLACFFVCENIAFFRLPNHKKAAEKQINSKFSSLLFGMLYIFKCSALLQFCPKKLFCLCILIQFFSELEQTLHLSLIYAFVEDSKSANCIREIRGILY